MATWMTHLRIAQNILKHNPGLEPGPLAIGNTVDLDQHAGNWNIFDSYRLGVQWAVPYLYD